MRRLVLALLTVFALLFAACGDDGDSDSDPSDERSLGTDGTGAHANDPDLDPKLLTADELGAGWSEDPGSRVADDEETSDGPACLQDPPNDPDHDRAHVSFTFDRDAGGFPTLQQQLTDYHDVDTMASAFDTAAAAIDSCGEFAYGAEGSEVAGRVVPLDGPSVGDASRTWTLHLSAQGHDFTAYILYARFGPVGMSLYFLDRELPDLAEFGEMVEMAVARL